MFPRRFRLKPHHSQKFRRGRCRKAFTTLCSLHWKAPSGAQAETPERSRKSVTQVSGHIPAQKPPGKGENFPAGTGKVIHLGSFFRWVGGSTVVSSSTKTYSNQGKPSRNLDVCLRSIRFSRRRLEFIHVFLQAHHCAEGLRPRGF